MEGSRLTKVKNYVNVIIKSMGIDDYFGIITFSDTAKIIGNNTTLLRATSANKSSLLKIIDNMVTNNTTNY